MAFSLRCHFNAEWLQDKLASKRFIVLLAGDILLDMTLEETHRRRALVENLKLKTKFVSFRP